MLRLENARILAVDDEAQILELIEALYQREGALLYKATDGDAAIAMAEELKPDLILLDVVMPGKSGYEVCRLLRANEATRRIPVILVTGLGSLTDKLKGLDAGADDFLNKPVNAAELIARSRTLLRAKGLSDQLEEAYRDMSKIAAFTNFQLLSFDPHSFNRSESRRELMDFLLSTTNSEKKLLEELAQVKAEKEKVAAELAALKSDTTDLSQLKEEHEALKKTHSGAAARIKGLSQENDALRGSSSLRWFLAGAAVLIVGALLGLTIGRRPKRWSGSIR